MMKFIRQGNYCLFSHIHKLIKMASDGHAKIYFVLGKLKLSLSCMKSVSSKSIDWACSSNQCFDALIEIKELSSQFQANNSLYILFNCRWRLQSIRHIIYLQYSYKKFEILDTYISTKCCQLKYSRFLIVTLLWSTYTLISTMPYTSKLNICKCQTMQ